MREKDVRHSLENRKTELFRLNKKLVRLAWEFCKFDIMNFMDFMDAPLNPADLDRIVRQEAHTIAETVLLEGFTKILLEQAEKEHTNLFQEWEESRK